MTLPLPRLTKAELYDYLAARIQFHRLEGWEGTSGEELLRAIAAAWARVLERVADREEGALILRATGPRRTTGFARIVRADTTKSLGMRQGQVITKTPWGVTFMLVDDAELGVGVNVLQNIPVEAEWSGWEGNVDTRDVSEHALPLDAADPAAAIAWTTTTSNVGKALFLAEIESGTALIEGKSAAEKFTGGALATLDLLANERGLPRHDGEIDPALKKRIRQLPDIITPGAILRAATAYLAPFGATATLEEPWDYAWTVGDAPNGTIGDGGISPIAGRPSFALMVHSLAYESEGWVVGDAPNGTIGDDYPIGVGDTEHAGVLAGLQALVDKIRLAGVDGRVFEEVA